MTDQHPSDLPFATDADVRNYAGRIQGLAAHYEFHTYTIGTLLKLQLSDEQGMEIKRNLNRRVAIAVAEALPGRDPTPGKSDITFLLQYPGRWVEAIPSPLYVYGRYLKFSRDLPQARWLCRRCHGRGCTECDYTGKIYENSVEEIIAAPLLQAFGAEASKMHATGRQDVDVRMLGNGRPFAIELVRPHVRTADLAALAEQINAASDSVAVCELQFASRDLVRRVDTARADKTYHATVHAERPVTTADMEKLQRLEGQTLDQKTPHRVAHRRADKIRRRRLHTVTAVLPQGKEQSSDFAMTITAEAGTYIKEFISGDKGRTVPSVSALLDTPCTCTQLDVTGVHFDPFSEH